MQVITCTPEQLRALINEELVKVLKVIKPAHAEKVYLTVEELSKYIHMSKPAIYARVSQNALPHMRNFGKIVFEKSEIDTWLLKNRS